MSFMTNLKPANPLDVCLKMARIGLVEGAGVVRVRQVVVVGVGLVEWGGGGEKGGRRIVRGVARVMWRTAYQLRVNKTMDISYKL